LAAYDFLPPAFGRRIGGGQSRVTRPSSTTPARQSAPAVFPRTWWPVASPLRRCENSTPEPLETLGRLTRPRDTPISPLTSGSPPAPGFRISNSTPLATSADRFPPSHGTDAPPISSVRRKIFQTLSPPLPPVKLLAVPALFQAAFMQGGVSAPEFFPGRVFGRNERIEAAERRKSTSASPVAGRSTGPTLVKPVRRPAQWAHASQKSDAPQTRETTGMPWRRRNVGTGPSRPSGVNRLVPAAATRSREITARSTGEAKPLRHCGRLRGRPVENLPECGQRPRRSPSDAVATSASRMPWKPRRIAVSV